MNDNQGAARATRLPLRQNTNFHISSTARHDCHLCGHGCRNYDVMLTEPEARRLSMNIWRPLLENVPDEIPLVVFDNDTSQYMLNKKPDGSCVFLGSDNLCIV